MTTDDITIAPIDDLANAPGLEPLFLAMYDHFAITSGRRYLNDRAFELWVGHYSKVAGRSRIVIGAWHAGELIGFIEGVLRAAPAYFDEGVLGYVSHLSVAHEHRGRSVARRLYVELVTWFETKKVASIELQVVQGNQGAHRFWQALGFASDAVQYRKKV